MNKENRNIQYICPFKIIESKGDIKNLEYLLHESDSQISIYEPDCFELNGEGFIVIDFGQEQAGGIRLLTNMAEKETDVYNLRIRFGESVSECYSDIGEKGSTNNHSIRDMLVTIPTLSDQSYGDTGFRFVRIDFLDKDKTIRIKSILAKCWRNNFKLLKNFDSSDAKLNKIFDVSKHTLELCIQNYIWDGIKRDRLVWVGDMEPEIHAILHLFGQIEAVEKSISISEKHNPMPCWMNGIPSYSMWYLLIVCEVLYYSKDVKFYRRHEQYFNSILDLINKGVSKNGVLDFSTIKDAPSNSYFIDWPSCDASEEDKINANKNLLIYILRQCINILNKFDIECNIGKQILARLELRPTNIPKLSQFAALHYLVNKDDESYNVLINNGSNGMTTFMSYYILTAIADRDIYKAIQILKEYYGGMLDRGATSFWENFSLSWLDGSGRIDEITPTNLKDLHGDYGDYCYKGYRHSLCHGWSCGPISFLLEQKGRIK